MHAITYTTYKKYRQPKNISHFPIIITICIIDTLGVTITDIITDVRSRK